MKIKDIREKDEAKIQEEIGELRKQLFTLRTQGATQNIENPSQLGKNRRDIARMLTVLNERRAAAAKK